MSIIDSKLNLTIATVVEWAYSHRIATAWATLQWESMAQDMVYPFWKVLDEIAYCYLSTLAGLYA